MSAVVALRPTHSLPDDEAFAVWELQMRVANCGARTIRERRILIGSLGEFLECPIVEASRTQLMEFLARPHLSPKTRQNYKSALHTFYTVLQDEGVRIDNPAARLPRGRSPRQEANPFSTAELQKLLDSRIKLRTRMMILLAAYQGFRAVEIASTSGAHIDWEQRMILTVDAKGGVEVWRPLHPMVLREALAHPDRFSRDGWWFPGSGPNGGAHVSPHSVSSVLSEAVRRAGIKHRPHQLRAWFATELMQVGADVLTIQHAMRHASPETLKHYIRPSLELIDAAMQSLPQVDVPSLTRSASDTCAVEGCDRPRRDAKHGRYCAPHRYEREKHYYSKRERGAR